MKNLKLTNKTEKALDLSKTLLEGVIVNGCDYYKNILNTHKNNKQNNLDETNQIISILQLTVNQTNLSYQFIKKEFGQDIANKLELSVEEV